MLLLITIVITLIAIGVTRSTIQSSRATEAMSLDRLTSVLRDFRFPLTPVVLKNMKSLSTAEFAVLDAAGRVQTQTENCPAFVTSNRAPGNVELADVEGFYHRVVRQYQEQDRAGQLAYIHIFYPRKSFQEILWDASLPPLFIGLLVLPVALIISLALANQVTRPLAKLRHQVEEIAQGNLLPIPESETNDEIRDLGCAINQMASQLDDREVQLKQNERLTTLIQVGNSTAHHLRNSATGCRMAIDLLASESDQVANSENYQVAKRQLELIETYIRKLMSISRADEPDRMSAIPETDPAKVLQEVLFLLSPTAEHLKVKLTVESKSDESQVPMSVEDVQQLMLNLIGNAINAASQELPSETYGKVEISLLVKERGLRFQVVDSGTGPPADIANSIFQPFVTSRSEGTGLGLFVVQEISDRAGAQIHWDRVHGQTEFVFELGS